MYHENVDRMTKTTIITWNICLGNRSCLRRGLIILLEFNEEHWGAAALCIHIPVCPYLGYDSHRGLNDNYHATHQPTNQPAEDEHEPAIERSSRLGQIGLLSPTDLLLLLLLLIHNWMIFCCWLAGYRWGGKTATYATYYVGKRLR